MPDLPSLTDLARGLIGLTFCIGVALAFSRARDRVDWRLVGTGLGLQIALAVLILRVPAVSALFDVLAGFFQAVLAYSEAGAQFLFGNLVTELDSFGYIFAFQVLPTIVFFSALSSVLFYLGILRATPSPPPSSRRSTRCAPPAATTCTSPTCAPPGTPANSC